MDIITYSETLQRRISEITSTYPEQHELARLAIATDQVRNVIQDLKLFVVRYEFVDAAEEVKFFKEIKPVLVSQYIFYKQLFKILVRDSFSSDHERVENYRVSLSKLQRFVQKNRAFYEYCLAGSTNMDIRYFTRERAANSHLQIDDRFSTGFDVKLSKILAFELLKKTLTDMARQSGGREIKRSENALKWTNSKVALIELIYALHTSGCFNNGNTDLKHIVESLQDAFDIDLGNYARVFYEIRLRKKGQTNFLDSLRDRLVKMMDETG